MTEVTTEFLLKMKNNLEAFQSIINETKTITSYISSQYDTNIGDVTDIYSKYFNDRFLGYLIEDIEKINCKIIKQLHINCTHEIISDSIDICPDRSLLISYCKICNLTYD